MTETRMSARRGTALLAVVVLALLVLPAANVAGGAGEGRGRLDPGLTVSGEALSSVIVQATESTVGAARAAVTRLGGKIGADLPLVDGFSATVPATGLRELSRQPGVRAVTANRVGRLATTSLDPDGVASNFVRSTGASTAWAAGNRGRGIGVAVVDTGVSEMPDFAGRLVHGPDLSGEGSIVDSFGHGTVMAGLVAGDGTDSRGRQGGAFTGVAPEATVVSVKVAGRNGAADVSTMLQALHWVAAYKDQFNIRVLSLSWGVASTQDPSVDPIDFAVERLWNQGIVVVVAAGNSGPSTGTISKPGDDPLVLTVGAYDDKQDSDPANDSIPAWASRGPTAQGLAKPDVVAPGRLLVAQRSFGSAIEQNNPEALHAPSYIRGSGSSQATAVTAGAAALLISEHPTWTPDQVKRALTSTARPMTSAPSYSQGAGRISFAAATSADPGPASSQTGTSSGLGSIEASRGGLHVDAACNGSMTTIQGEMDARCEAWDGHRWAGSQWTGSQWTGSQWTSAEYDSWLSLTWGVAFFGDMPAFWQQVPGETSEPAPLPLLGAI